MINELIYMLEKQSIGEERYFKEITILIESLFSTKVFRHDVYTSQQIYALERIMSEWKGMFSFYPGRIEGINSIISLLEFIKYKQSIDISDVYRHAEWKKIIELRGPVETVIKNVCKVCGTDYHSMGTNGFIDDISLVCSECGNVCFQSQYKERDNLMNCVCGGKYTIGCPKCLSFDRESVSSMSPFEYFYNHRFKRI